MKFIFPTTIMQIKYFVLLLLNRKILSCVLVHKVIDFSMPLSREVFDGTVLRHTINVPTKVIIKKEMFPEE